MHTATVTPSPSANGVGKWHPHREYLDECSPRTGCGRGSPRARAGEPLCAYGHGEGCRKEQLNRPGSGDCSYL